ncbi:MAG: vitamin K epoxide reductase family protein [Cyanothece sp. SIO2G6]|nr:vitamin K epoxide reductase family protein [Cyanothece sp. SIO2G6]
MVRKKQTTWMHRNSRYVIAGVATAGLLLSVGCLAKGNTTLSGSAYIRLAGLSLPLLGAIAYGLMGALAIGPVLTKNKALEGPTWLGLFTGSTAMVIFSGYLLYVMFAVLQEPCVPCILSALLTLGLWGLTLVGKPWDDLGQLLLPGICVMMITGLITTGLHAYASNPDTFSSQGNAPQVTTTSGESEIALAQHLSAIGVKKYGAWWCPHCHAQQTLFGQQAFEYIDYVECDEAGVDPQPQACRAAGVQSYPTWEINGETYAGVQSLQTLATLSGYSGPQNFTNQLPNHQ